MFLFVYFVGLSKFRRRFSTHFRRPIKRVEIATSIRRRTSTFRRVEWIDVEIASWVDCMYCLFVGVLGCLFVCFECLLMWFLLLFVCFLIRRRSEIDLDQEQREVHHEQRRWDLHTSLYSHFITPSRPLSETTVTSKQWILIFWNDDTS